jgi:PAS domain S-box-containing protein
VTKDNTTVYLLALMRHPVAPREAGQNLNEGAVPLEEAADVRDILSASVQKAVHALKLRQGQTLASPGATGTGHRDTSTQASLRVGLLAILGGIAMRYAAFPLIGFSFPFLPFLLATIFAAYMRGWVSGMIAMTGGLAAGIWLQTAPPFLPAPDVFTPVMTVGYLIASAVVTFTIDRLQRHRNQVEYLAAELRESQQALQRSNDELGKKVEALKEEKDFTDALMNASPGLFYLLDSEGKLIRWNLNVEQVSGFSHEEVALMAPTDFFPGTDRPRVLERITKVFIEGFATLEAPILTKQGDIIPHFFTGVRVMIGHKPYLAGLAVDISKRMEAEAQLQVLNEGLEQKVGQRTQELQVAQQRDRVSFQRLRTIISRLSVGVLATDEKGVILESNDLFCHYFLPHEQPKRLLGLHLKDIAKVVLPTFTDDPETYNKSHANILEKHEQVLGEEIRLRNGRILLRDYLPVFEEGTFSGQIFIYRDVTHERRVDSAKSEFMSLASHQLRTPLTGIRWTIGRLAKNLHGKIGEMDERYIRESERSAVRMSQTIDTMLKISHIESGSVQLTPSDIPLSSFVEEIVAHYQEDIERKRLRLSVDCAEIVLTTDEQLLREAVSNLLSNATKYTPDEGSLRVRAVLEDEKVRIKVEDSGYGIPAEQQPKIFGKFFRGENIVSKDTQGTGLGLYLVSLIAEILGGEIQVVSEENKGSVFTLVLPVAANDG